MSSCYKVCPGIEHSPHRLIGELKLELDRQKNYMAVLARVFEGHHLNIDPSSAFARATLLSKTLFVHQTEAGIQDLDEIWDLGAMPKKIGNYEVCYDFKLVKDDDIRFSIPRILFSTNLARFFEGPPNAVEGVRTLEAFHRCIQIVGECFSIANHDPLHGMQGYSLNGYPPTFLPHNFYKNMRTGMLPPEYEASIINDALWKLAAEEFPNMVADALKTGIDGLKELKLLKELSDISMPKFRDYLTSYQALVIPLLSQIDICHELNLNRPDSVYADFRPYRDEIKECFQQLKLRFDNGSQVETYEEALVCARRHLFSYQKQRSLSDECYSLTLKKALEGFCRYNAAIEDIFITHATPEEKLFVNSIGHN